MRDSCEGEWHELVMRRMKMEPEMNLRFDTVVERLAIRDWLPSFE